MFNAETLDAALKICPLLRMLEPLPKEGRGIPRELWDVLARTYQGASGYLDENKKVQAAAGAREVMNGLREAQDKNRWVNGCNILISEAQR